MKKHTIKIKFKSEDPNNLFVKMNRITVEHIESAIKVLQWHIENAFNEDENAYDDIEYQENEFSPEAEHYATKQEMKEAKKLAKKRKKDK